jgi:hypothetical protein
VGNWSGNESLINANISALNVSKAGTGSCTPGQYVVNTTSGGVECADGPSDTYINSTIYTNSNVSYIIQNISLNGSDVVALVGNWSADKGSYYLNSETYNKTQTNTLFNNLSASNIVSLVGNWSADKSSYATGAQLSSVNTSLSANISALNLTSVQTTNIVALVGNWSADKSSYALQGYVTSLGNWSADKASYATVTQVTGLNTSLQVNLSAINLTFISNDSGLQARIASLNTSFALNISDLNISKASVTQLTGLNASLQANISSLNISKAGLGANTFTGNQTLQSGLVLSTTTAKSACAAGIRGTFWVDQGGAGVSDLVYLCMKNSSDSYIWVLLGRGD